jgi:hypothetical protein
MFGGSKKCGACTKSIYPNDPSLSMGDKVYHKSCSKCSTCKGQLTIKNFATSGDRLLCKTHFMNEFHESGGVYGGDERFKQNQSRSNSTASNSSTASPKVGEAPTPSTENEKTTVSPKEIKFSPTQVEKTAPKAEKQKISSGSSVADLIKKTNRTSVTSGSGSAPSSQPRRRKTRSFGGGGKKCGACGKTIYANDGELSMGDLIYHKTCSKCETCKKQLTITNFATSGNRLLCKTHFMEEFSVSGGQYGGGERFKQKSGSQSSVCAPCEPEASANKVAEAEKAAAEEAAAKVAAEKVAAEKVAAEKAAAEKAAAEKASAEQAAAEKAAAEQAAAEKAAAEQAAAEKAAAEQAAAEKAAAEQAATEKAAAEQAAAEKAVAEKAVAEKVAAEKAAAEKAAVEKASTEQAAAEKAAAEQAAAEKAAAEQAAAEKAVAEKTAAEKAAAEQVAAEKAAAEQAAAEKATAEEAMAKKAVKKVKPPLPPSTAKAKGSKPPLPPAGVKPKVSKPRMSRFGGGSKKCGACGKTIYPNDPQLSIGDKLYHKSCAKCEVCRGQLTISNFSTSGNRLLCKTHFMEEFSQSGGTYGGDERFKKASSRSSSNASNQ